MRVFSAPIFALLTLGLAACGAPAVVATVDETDETDETGAVELLCPPFVKGLRRPEIGMRGA